MILDLFAGGGGWAEGCRQLGLSELGIEIDRWACATRAVAGHPTIRADVATYATELFRGRVEGLVISPPCADFSRAGKRVGINGETGRLVHEVMRWAEGICPVWVACEQVPDVLPIWREFAWRLRRLGYSTWAGCLLAADHGVPQTRERAFLLAHRERPALPPEPTHCRGGREAGLFVPALQPWVSMAEALGADGVDRPAQTIAGNRAPRWAYAGNETTGWTLHTNRDQRSNGDRQTVAVDRPAPALTGKSGGQWVLRSNNSTQGGARPEGLSRTADEPALTVDSMAMQWTFVNGNQPRAARRELHEPAPTIAFGHNAERIEWVAERPATTIAGSFARGRVAAPGHHDTSTYEQPEAVRVSVQEAAILQGFRPDYPWQGTKTARFRQVGDAVPPPLAAAVIGALIGRTR